MADLSGPAFRLMPIRLQAGAAVNGGRFVKIGASDNSVIHCAAGDNAIGVAQADAAANADVVVDMDGIADVEVGAAAIARGAAVAAAADGKAVTQASSAETVGRALAAAAANGVVKIRIVPN